MRKHIISMIALIFIFLSLFVVGADFTEKFALLMIIGAYVFVLSFILCRKFNSKTLKILSIIYRFLFIIFVIVFIVIESIIWNDIIANKKITANENVGYVIVLGAGVHGDKMGSILQSRVDSAIDYLNIHKDAKIICSGGQGPGESIPESKAMAAYCEKKGIAKDRILLDEKSTTTIQNLEYSKDILENLHAQNEKVIIVTSSFNILRAKIIANKMGINADYIGSNSKFRFNLNYSVREFGAILYNYLELAV